MAFSSGIAISPDDPGVVTTNQVTFDTIAINGQSCVRSVAGLDLDTPHVMTISHETVKSTGVKRHLIRLDYTAQDATDPAILGDMSVYMNIVVPPIVGDATVLLAMVRSLANFICASGNVTKILNGEI